MGEGGGGGWSALFYVSPDIGRVAFWVKHKGKGDVLCGVEMSAVGFA